jgi:hypothetical protein
MSKEKVYEVLTDTLTIHRTTAELKSTDGTVTRQNGMGKVYLKTELVPESLISKDYIDALENSDNPLHGIISKKLKLSSGDSKEDIARRLALPFEGFDIMTEDELFSAMTHLPSAAISKIKEYELGRSEPRQRIVNYSVGFGESGDDRQLGKTGSGMAIATEGKPTSELETREVKEDGPVQQGDGVTGIGVPAKGKIKNPGATLTGVKESKKKGLANKKPVSRRGTRPRTTE